MVEYYQRRSDAEPLERVKKPYTTTGLWIHIPDKKVDIARLSELYGLDENVVRDVFDQHELPRSEYKNHNQYVFMRLPSSAVDGAATVPILAIMGQHYFITITPHVDFSPQKIDVFLTTSVQRPSNMLAAVLAGVVTEYERRVNVLEEKIIHARRRLKSTSVQNTDFIEFVTIEDRLNEYRSNLEGMLGVTKQLQVNRYGLFHTHEVELIEDIMLHVEQLLVSISASSQTITSIQNAYSTIANNTLNQRMKLLTAITILLAIPNVFYGMYGMNVTLPFQHEPWAYSLIVGFTVLLIVLVFFLAKRSRLF